ncbi:MAG: chemotaxis protein CheB [Polyangiaceae bacterium]
MGIGASAGGLDALERLFTKLPPDIPMAFVVAQHLSPDHKSMMVELLGKRTALTVMEASDDVPLARGRVYLVPAHANVVVSGDRLRLSSRAAPHTLNLPIDQLFRSLASSFAERAVAIVLSGTGSDGRQGVLAVKDAGGVALVQDPTTARFDGMPREAMRTGVVDAVLSPEDLAAELERMGGDRVLLDRVSQGAETQDLFGGLIAQVRKTAGFDLAAYKQSTVLRRIERRLTARGVSRLEDYTELVANEPDESRLLLNEVLINVTEYFRDRPVFDALESRYLPDLQGRFAHESIRIWVPGCSSGEEAYSLAILLAELNADFKLFGTDIDDDALARAAAGVFDASTVVGLAPARLERFFVKRDGHYEVDRELRKRVVFAKHNLLGDPPFTRMHMVSCRNLLIYLTPEGQRRALDAFSFALKPGGLLVLGSSEVLGDRFEDFKVADSHLKLFVRKDGRHAPLNLNWRSRTPATQTTSSDEEQASTGALRILTDRVAEAAVLVSEHLRIVRVFGNGGSLLTLDVGAPSLDMMSLLPERLRPVASVAVHRALSTSQEVALLATENDKDVATVRAIPFSTRNPVSRFVLVIFESRTNHPAIEVTCVDAAQVGLLQRELDTARQSLQAAVEELETSNEELQATNEELLASNEELQATNEELQSVNEELHTVNVEHQARITELSDTNADLDNLLNATPVATLFLDEKLRIRRFNPPVSALFPVVEADRGRPLSHFTSDLLTTPLTAELDQVLRHAQTIEREVSTSTGSRFYMRAVPHVSPLRRVCGVVLTFSNITALHETRESQDLLQAVIDALPANVAVLDDEGVIQFVNAAWLEFAKANGGGAVSVGANYLDACHDAVEVRTALEAVLRGQRTLFECEYPCHSPTEARWFLMHVRRTGDGRRTVVAHTDVSQLRGGKT